MNEFLFTWKDPFGNELSRSFILENFEHDFVVCLTKITTECKWSKLVTKVEENEVVGFRGLRSTSKGNVVCTVDFDAFRYIFQIFIPIVFQDTTQEARNNHQVRFTTFLSILRV